MLHANEDSPTQRRLDTQGDQFAQSSPAPQMDVAVQSYVATQSKHPDIKTPLDQQIRLHTRLPLLWKWRVHLLRPLRTARPRMAVPAQLRPRASSAHRILRVWRGIIRVAYGATSIVFGVHRHEHRATGLVHVRAVMRGRGHGWRGKLVRR